MKAKKQYLNTLQVSGYSILALHSRIILFQQWVIMTMFVLVMRGSLGATCLAGRRCLTPNARCLGDTCTCVDPYQQLGQSCSE